MAKTWSSFFLVALLAVLLSALLVSVSGTPLADPAAAGENNLLVREKRWGGYGPGYGWGRPSGGWGWGGRRWGGWRHGWGG